MKQISLDRKQGLVLIILLGLTVYGFDAELLRLYGLEESNAFYGTVFMGTATLGLYILPFFWLYHHFRKQMKIPLSTVLISLVTGLFGTSRLAIWGNDVLSHFWKSILPSATFEEWESALTAPFAEEIVKVAIVFLVLVLVRAWDKRTVFMTGMMVGMGFQIMEDIAYITDGALETKNIAVSSALSRISGGLASHYLYTALLAVGLYYFFKASSEVSKGKALFWIFFPILSHFLWNSPLNTDLVAVLIMADSLLVFLDLFFFISKEEKGEVEKKFEKVLTSD